MALFPNPQDALHTNSKTHTNLVVSEGNAPAEQFLVSKTNEATPFIYEYGPEGNQTVLIAKGKIVEAVGEEKNRNTGYTETAIRVAGEGSTRAIGVNHHNVYDQRRDAMEGNRPTVITRSYIEVPLFEHGVVDTAADSAAAMHFGAAYGATGDIKSGDFVVVGKDGNFKKAPEDLTDFRQVVGQVFNVNRNMPPAGLLNYYTGLKENADVEAYLKSVSTTPAASEGGYPYGAPYSVGSWKADFLKSLGNAKNTGIPFLTDGYFSSLKTLTVGLEESENLESVVASEGATITGANVTVSEDVMDSSVFIKLKHKIDQASKNDIKVTYTNAEAEEVTVSSRDVHVDLVNNTIVVFLDGGVEATGLSVTLTASVNPVAGIPTEWDYAGSVGAVRIQLMR